MCICIQLIGTVLMAEFIEEATYRKAHFESCTIPSSKRIRTGTRNVPNIEEFEGDKFAINLGEYIKFKHTPILMRDDITEHRLIGEYEVSD